MTCNDDQASDVAALLEQYGARELKGQIHGWCRYHAFSLRCTETTGRTAIPIVEEQLAVGKREVDRGGVRVYSHVVEKRVRADVTLRDEKILVERRPVNHIASAADFNMGQGSVIELNATGEEAFVGKMARVARTSPTRITSRSLEPP